MNTSPHGGACHAPFPPVSKPQAVCGVRWRIRQILSLLAGGAAAFATGTQAYSAGASLPFKSIEAESGTLAGGASVVALTSPPTNSHSSPTLEASGHAYVQLDATNEAVTLTNNTGGNVTGLNIRYCIPDSAGGGGISATLNVYVNGTFRQTITLSSAQSWCYQTSGSQHGWDQSPSAGQPHIFYDEMNFFIAAPAVPNGATITFKKDAANTAAFYRLDVVDMENPPGPLSQPANSLSITSYGAVANDPNFDSESAIQSCINAAQSQGKSVWVPQGTFYLKNSTPSLSATGITMEGAGIWYSTIYANPTLPATPNGNILYPTSCTVRNLKFESNSVSGGPGGGNPGGLNVKGSNWLMENLWIRHMGAGVWANGTNGIVRNVRTQSTWADGININNGNGAPGNETGNNLTVTNCFVRGSGDDGIAINSGAWPGCIQMAQPAVTNCTAVAPWWANCIGIYGGANITVSNNLCTDSVGAYGLSLGQFGSTGFPIDSGSATNNVIIRGGSYGFYNQAGVPALNVGTTAAVKNLTVDGNVVRDSMFMGMGVELCGVNVNIQYNQIVNAGTAGIRVPSNATGSPTLRSNAVIQIKSGQTAYSNGGGGGYTPSLVNNSWQSWTKKLTIGSSVSLRANVNTRYVSADNNGASPLIANKTTAGTYEHYVVVDAGEGTIGLRCVGNTQYVCAESEGNASLIANRPSVGAWERFFEVDAGSGNTALRSMANNRFVCAENGGAAALIANRNGPGPWESFLVGP